MKVEWQKISFANWHVYPRENKSLLIIFSFPLFFEGEGQNTFSPRTNCWRQKQGAQQCYNMLPVMAKPARQARGGCIHYKTTFHKKGYQMSTRARATHIVHEPVFVQWLFLVFLRKRLPARKKKRECFVVSSATFLSSTSLSLHLWWTSLFSCATCCTRDVCFLITLSLSLHLKKNSLSRHV